jgi:hypothetical protein
LASDAAVFWQPRLYSRSLRFSAAPAKQGAPVLDLSLLTSDLTVLRANRHEYHVLLQNDGRSLQLEIQARSLSSPLRLVTEALWPHPFVKHKLIALEALNLLIHTGTLPRRLFPADPRSRRLSVVLQALDGALAGTSHREIAESLFGPERVSRDWADPGNHLRDQVRRAIRRGHYLMAKGYLDLLR